jgi:hypothetical protein
MERIIHVSAAEKEKLAESCARLAAPAPSIQPDFAACEVIESCAAAAAPVVPPARLVPPKQ